MQHQDESKDNVLKLCYQKNLETILELIDKFFSCKYGKISIINSPPPSEIKPFLFFHFCHMEENSSALSLLLPLTNSLEMKAFLLISKEKPFFFFKFFDCIFQIFWGYLLPSCHLKEQANQLYLPFLKKIGYFISTLQNV